MVWTAVMPRIDWSAARQPGILEKALAKSVIGRWINYNANTAANPIPPTAENLKAGQNEYEEHCATCPTVLTERARTVSEPISIRRCLNSPEISKSYPTRNFIS